MGNEDHEWIEARFPKLPSVAGLELSCLICSDWLVRIIVPRFDPRKCDY